MSLESGLLHGVVPKDHIGLTVQHALAYQLNAPIQIIRRDFGGILRSEAALAGVDLDSVPESLLKRISYFYDHSEVFKTVFANAVDKAVPYPPSYAGPFSRIMRDYWAWSWSELIEIAKQCIHASTLSLGAVFPSNPGFPKVLASYLAPLDEQYFMLIGPCLILDSSMVAQDVDRILYEAINDFNSFTAHEWKTVQNRKHSSDHANSAFGTTLHSTREIFRSIYIRARTSPADLSSRAKKGQVIYNSISQSDQFSIQHWRPDAYSHVVAALSTAYEISQSNRDLELPIAFPDVPCQKGGRPTRMAVRVQQHRDRFELIPLADYDQHQDQMDTHSALMWRRNLDAAFTSWNAYRLESLALLRGSLTSNFGAYAFGSSYDHGPFTNVSDRIVRFVSRSFDADEGFLYKLDYGTKYNCLLLSAYYTYLIRDPTGLVKLSEHMLAVGRSSSERRKSISYRAADTQITKFTHSYKNGSERMFPHDEPLSLPAGVILPFRVSVISAPIMVNGRIFGVIELTSKREFNFPLEAQRRVEEVCHLLASFFYHQFILVETDRIYNLMLGDASFSDKLQNICQSLPDLFMCNGVGIFFRARDGELIPYAGSRRPDILEIISAGAKGGLECTTAGVLSDHGEHDIEHNIIGVAPFDDDFLETKAGYFFADKIGWRLTIIPLVEKSPSENSPKAFGYITLLFDESSSSRITTPLSELLMGYAFLRGFLTVTLQMIYSNFVWEHSTRSNLNHEITRIAIELSARAKRVQHAALGITDSNVKYQVVKSLKDVESSLKDIERLSEIVESISFSDREDPLVKLARREIGLENIDSLSATSVRDLVNEIFASRRTVLNERQIKVVNNVSDPSIGIKLTLSVVKEILGNLAENAVKYSLDNTPIEISIERNEAGLATLIIQNRGPLMTESERRRVFDEGFRSEYAYRKNIPGTGRGLTYAKSLMSLILGTISYRLQDDRKRINREPSLLHILEVRFPVERVVWPRDSK